MQNESGSQAVAALIDARRKALKLTDAKVAELAGVHYNTLGNWRRGRGVSLSALSQVADVLDLRLTSLCDAYQGRAGHPDDPPPSEGTRAVLERLDGRLEAVEATLELLAEVLGAARSPDGPARGSSAESHRS